MVSIDFQQGRESLSASPQVCLRCGGLWRHWHGRQVAHWFIRQPRTHQTNSESLQHQVVGAGKYLYNNKGSRIRICAQSEADTHIYKMKFLSPLQFPTGLQTLCNMWRLKILMIHTADKDGTQWPSIMLTIKKPFLSGICDYSVLLRKGNKLQS